MSKTSTSCSCNDRPWFPAKVRATVNGFERIISFKPGHVCERFIRNRNDRGNHGRHGMDLLMLLKGPRGCIQFTVYTGWMPDWKEFDNEPDGLHPLPADFGYHSPAPMYEGQESMASDCPWLGGECYYDGSGLRAADVFKLLVSEGEEAVWVYMQEEYESRFALTAEKTK